MEIDSRDQEAFDRDQKDLESLGLKPAEAEEVAEQPAETPEDAEPEEKPEVTAPKPDEVSDEVAPKDFNFKEYKTKLRDELQSDFDKKLEALKQEMGKEKPSETKTENLEDDIKKLAAELDFDEDKVRKIVEVARKGIETLSPEDKEILNAVRAKEADLATKAEDLEQEATFNGEWSQVLPAVKTYFPNASEEQIAQAKETLDFISHSEKYHNLELSEIVQIFKTKDFTFVDAEGKEQALRSLDKLMFSPRQATFESPRPADVPADTEEWPEITSDMTPNEVAKIEKQQQRILDAMPKEKTKVTTRGEDGRVVQREE